MSILNKFDTVHNKYFKGFFDWHDVEELLRRDDCEIVDMVEGALCDSFWIRCGKKIIVAFENYVSCWASNNSVFAWDDDTDKNMTDDKDLRSIYEAWDRLAYI